MREIKENGIDLERKSGDKKPKSKYYIIPEGDKTEIQYFRGIRSCREELNIKPLIEIRLIENDDNEKGESHPIRKLNNFKKTVQKEEINYFPEIDKAIFVIDRDPQNFSEQQLDNFMLSCEAEGYDICLSNPTFELFLLMHDDEILKLDKEKMLENKREKKRGKRFLEKKVSEIFGCNKTNLRFEKFKPNIDKAIKNERQFCEELEGLKKDLGSNVGKMIDSMIIKK